MKRELVSDIDRLRLAIDNWGLALVNEMQLLREAIVSINIDRKTEPNCSEKPNNFDKDINVRSKDEPQTPYDDCKLCKWWFEYCHLEMCDYEPKDEPQTETEIAKAIVHKMIDNSDIAEDAYPDLRQRMHEAVERLDEYYPSEGERSE